MTQLLIIQDDKIVIKTLVLESTSGAVSHTGTLNVSDSVNVGTDLAVAGTITAGTVRVKNLITESGTIEGVGQWTVSTEDELNGKGLGWTWGGGTVRLMYKDGGRIWSNGDFDLDSGKSYKIDNTPVISLNQLGSQVKKSSLTEVGTLKNLAVSGDVSLGEVMFVNSSVNRIGINTENPKGVFSIVENDVEIVIDSPALGKAVIGTHTNTELSIVTDNTPRLTVKKSGEIHIGNEQYKTGVLRVFGTIHAENIITDTRVERSQSLEFKPAGNDNIYGKGLVWFAAGSTKQLVMQANPDRLVSSESIDLANGKQYHINNLPVISAFGLGPTVVSSQLTSVGTLQSLTVNGLAKFNNGIEVDTLTAKTIAFESMAVDKYASISVQGEQGLYIDNATIELGNKDNTRRAVKVFGQLSVGINTPDSTVDLAVKGNISFADKKFSTGTQPPVTGAATKGDIIWNSNPTEFSYIGWVCIATGEPGTWLPFGAIVRQ